MATRASSGSQNRQGGGAGYGSAGRSVAVGNDAVTRMAREDTRWFIFAVVVLSLVLFLALPLSVLVYVDTIRLQSEVRYEIRQMKKKEKELNEKANTPKPTDAGGV